MSGSKLYIKDLIALGRVLPGIAKQMKCFSWPSFISFYRRTRIGFGLGSFEVMIVKG